MDNLTHTLAGFALARTRLGKMSPGAVSVLIIGANLPDLDLVLRPFGGQASYVEHHRGTTHAVVGIAVQIVVLAVVAWIVERRVAPERASRMPWGRGSPLWPAVAGLLSHPLLDSLNEYGLRPWLPFSNHWVYGDLVYIVDPWLWLIFGGTALLAGPRSRRVDVAAGFLALLTTGVFVAYASGILTQGVDVLPRYFFAVWIPALVGLFALRRRSNAAGAWRRALRIGAIAFVAYVAVLTGARSIAERRVSAAIDATVARSSIVSCSMSPRLATPFRWECIVCTATDAFWFPIELFGEPPPPPRRLARHLDHPAVIAAAGSDEERAWRDFARHPLVLVDADGNVTLTDARYWFTDFCRISLTRP